MFPIVRVLLLSLLICGTGINAAQFRSPAVQVTDFELPAYLGRWYQVYASHNTLSTDESDATCVVEDHSRFVGPSFDVVAMFGVQITFNKNSPSGEVNTLQGLATNRQFRESPTKFSLHLEPGDIHTSHWILALGDLQYEPPLNEGIDPGVMHGAAPGKPTEGEYPWAIVSDMTSSTLFVLARDVQEFTQKYEAFVLKKVEELGFTGQTMPKPVKIEHGADCVYAEVPAVRSIGAGGN